MTDYPYAGFARRLPADFTAALVLRSASGSSVERSMKGAGVPEANELIASRHRMQMLARWTVYSASLKPFATSFLPGSSF